MDSSPRSPFDRQTDSGERICVSLRRYWVKVGESEWIVDVADPGAEVLEGTVEISVRPERVHVIG